MRLPGIVVQFVLALYTSVANAAFGARAAQAQSPACPCRPILT
jgi:hypothetical protein